MTPEQILNALVTNDVTEELIEILGSMYYDEIWPIYMEGIKRTAKNDTDDIYEIFQFVENTNMHRILLHAGFDSRRYTINKTDEPPEHAVYLLGCYDDHENKVVYLNPSVSRVEKDIIYNPDIPYLLSRVFVYGNLIINGHLCYIEYVWDVPILRVSKEKTTFFDILAYASYYYHANDVNKYHLRTHYVDLAKEYRNIMSVVSFEDFKQYYPAYVKGGIKALKTIAKVENARKRSLEDGIRMALYTDAIVDYPDYLPEDFKDIINKYLKVRLVIQDIEVKQFLRVRDIIFA